MTPEPDLLKLNNPEALVSDLLAWFATECRDLPWRRSVDLYGIWISEIMLQQTTVQAVIPFWERFLARFPSVNHLAEASEPEVLEMWSGLGYYSRARNLHAAAQMICRDRSGQWPRDCAEWQTLPGVGPYAGGAIASIGLGEAVPALDANARRVLQRWATLDPAALAALPAGQRNRLVDTLGANLVPKAAPGTWNEAVMELGALICGARRASCEVCPVRSHCNAWLGDWVADVPPPKKKTAHTPVWVGQLHLTWRNRIFLTPPAAKPLGLTAGARAVVRDDFTSLHGGLWGLPMTPWLQGHDAPEVTGNRWCECLGIPAGNTPTDETPYVLGRFRHGITNHNMQVDVLHLILNPRGELPHRLLGHSDGPDQDSLATPGLFFATEACPVPVSKLTEKGLHFHRDTVV